MSGPIAVRVLGLSVFVTMGPTVMSVVLVIVVVVVVPVFVRVLDPVEVLVDVQVPLLFVVRPL